MVSPTRTALPASRAAKSDKLGFDYPYARAQRYFVRQTIDLGGETQKADADVNLFAQSYTANRLVLWVGKFAIVDVFDTNKYANNPKTDFMNWTLINAGTFDYAGDAWGYTYGAAAEWYQGIFTLRAGVFDLSAMPAGGALNAAAYGLDNTFSQQQYVGEIEERHQLLGPAGQAQSYRLPESPAKPATLRALSLFRSPASRSPAIPAPPLRRCATATVTAPA